VKHLILYVSTNSHGKRDGDEFTREARAYSRYHADRGGECVSLAVPMHLPALRRIAAVEKALLEAREELGEPFDVFSFFGHGTERWIQTGHVLARLPGLASTLARVLSPSPVLWWASCRTAADNPRAPRPGELSTHGILQQTILRLLEHGVRALGWGHTTAGHTTRNPNLAMVNPFGGLRVTPAERFTLQRELWRDDSDLRFRIPLAKSVAELILFAKN
jgi:hypothetical protein